MLEAEAGVEDVVVKGVVETDFLSFHSSSSLSASTSCVSSSERVLTLSSSLLTPFSFSMFSTPCSWVCVKTALGSSSFGCSFGGAVSAFFGSFVAEVSASLLSVALGSVFGSSFLISCSGFDSDKVGVATPS